MWKRTDLFRRTPLAGIIGDHPLVAIDVGSRGGFEADLDPLAWAVDAVGFEPNPEELQRLQRETAGTRQPWRSIRHVPAALSGTGGTRRLHVPVAPESASLLEHDASVGTWFGKPAMFTVEQVIDVETMTLDDALTRFAIPAPHYLKLDIEGAELEVLSSSPRALASTLVLKTEVAFLPMRRDQPLATDVDLFLRGHGFHLIDLVEPVHWRRGSYVAHPQLTAEGVPYSRGQIAHGDFLYFKEPDAIPSADVPSALRAAVLSMAHGFFDYASALLARPEVERHLRERYQLDPTRAVRSASLALGRRVWANAFSEHLRRIVTFLRSAKAIASAGTSR
jgi:FkbM family methyltransferase